MSSKAHMPPVPPAGRSPQASGHAGGSTPGGGELNPADAKREARDRGENANQKGEGANIAQNTRNPGYQQDR